MKMCDIYHMIIKLTSNTSVKKETLIFQGYFTSISCMLSYKLLSIDVTNLFAYLL